MNQPTVRTCYAMTNISWLENGRNKIGSKYSEVVLPIDLYEFAKTEGYGPLYGHQICCCRRTFWRRTATEAGIERMLESQFDARKRIAVPVTI